MEGFAPVNWRSSERAHLSVRYPSSNFG